MQGPRKLHASDLNSGQERVGLLSHTSLLSSSVRSNADLLSLLVAAPKLPAAGQQMKQDMSRRRSTRSHTTSSTPKTPAVAKPKSDIQKDPTCPGPTAPKTTTPEKKRQQQQPMRKHQKSASLTEDKQLSRLPGPSQPATTKISPANASGKTHPTPASLNEDCQNSLKGRCRLDERSDRIHSHDENRGLSILTGTNTTSNRAVSTSNVLSAAQPDLHGRKESPSISDLAKSGAPLRYQPERGIVAAEIDNGQTSDDSQDTPGLSPQGSLCSLASEDSSVAKNHLNAHPPPPSRYFCRHWLQKMCKRTYDCPFVHGDLEYDIPIAGIYPRPQEDTICSLWQKGSTEQDKNIDNILAWDAEATSGDDREEDRKDDDHNTYPPPKSNASVPLTHIPSTKPTPVDEIINDPPVGQRPAPRNQNVCINWLHGRCRARYACKYHHEDLEYDPPASKSVTAPSAANETAEGRVWSVKVHDHARVKVGPGFEIQALQTGFETPWIYLGNIPGRVTDKEVADLLQPFGEVADIRLPTRVSNPTMLVRARFATPENARDASTALHNSLAFGAKITARLPMHNVSLSNAMFNDTSVRIRWEAPSRSAYCGYSTMKLAEAGMQVARQKVFRDRHIYASIHVGLPVVGVVTVCFRGLPVDTKKEDMAWFAKPDDVVWARPNYQDLDLARTSIRRILQQDSELLDFTVQPPPYRNARVQAWAHFATPSDAKAACRRLHGRKPVFTGRTRIIAEYLQSLSFSIPATTYEKISSDIQALSQTVRLSRRTTMSVVERPAPMATLIKLSGDDLKELGQLKAELSKILNWETIHQGATIAWDPFFAHPAGQSFLANINNSTPSVTIHVDIPRHMIRLLGSSTYRLGVRQQILDKITELQTRQIRTIPLDGWLLGKFMKTDLAQLQERFGYENLKLDFYRRCLIVRGENTVYQAAKDVVLHARRAQFHPARRPSAALCPVLHSLLTSRLVETNSTIVPPQIAHRSTVVLPETQCCNALHACYAYAPTVTLRLMMVSPVQIQMVTGIFSESGQHTTTSNLVLGAMY
ncbi:hypothetical protein C0995_015776 [Termitomyces sp. Mi166|nr:hypothetical protein C0995_015776 [Termitomyces sp. Mi166\